MALVTFITSTMRRFMALPVIFMLSGCATWFGHTNQQVLEPPVMLFQATGYAALPSDNALSSAKQKIIAMRASQLDAYRQLSEQLFGVSLHYQSSRDNWNTPQVHLQVNQNIHLPGVRIISSELSPDGLYKTVVELTLTEQQHQALLMSHSSCSFNCQTQGLYAIE